MVRLKQRVQINGLNLQFRLNFTMVRLKPPLRTTKNRIIKLSQFHYGSIKTKIQLIILTVSLPSQFHYGSIKTITSTTDVLSL